MRISSTRILQYILGLFIKTFGLSLIIRSDLGTGAWEAFYIGLADKTNLSIGLWVFTIGFFLIWINAFLWRRRPTYSSFFTVTIVAFFIDWWIALIQIYPSEIGLQMSMFWSGLIIASIGASIYLLSNFPPTPVDQFMFALSHRFCISIMYAKTTGEVFALLLAMWLHGSVGIGTIIFTFLFGPLIQFFMARGQLIMGDKYRH